MNVKKLLVLIILIFSFTSIYAQDNSNIIKDYIKTVELKQNAFQADSSFYKVLTGKKYFSLLDSAKTQENLKAFAQNHKNNPFIYYVLGEFYRIGGNYKLALPYYDSSISVASNSYNENLILYRYFKKRGNLQYSKKALLAMYNVSLNRGVTAYPLLSEYFKYKSYTSYIKNNFIDAIQFNNVAIELNNKDPSPYIIRSFIHQKNNPSLVLKDIAQFIIVLTTDLRNKIFFYANSTRVIYFALFWTIFLFVIVLYLKNIDLLAERLYKLIKTKNRLFYYVMFVILLFSPFVWFNNIFYIFIVLLLYLAYARINKGILYFSSFILMLLIVTTIGDSINLKLYSPDSEISKITSFLQNPWDTDLGKHIEALREKDTKNTFTYDFILALSFKKRGASDSAYYYYRDAYKHNPNSPSLMNNIGNIFYLRGEYDSAFAYYSKSLKLNAKNAALHYNLAQYYQHTLELNKASDEMEKAFALDFDRINAFAKNASNQYNRKLIDNNIDKKFLDSMLKKYLLTGISFNNLFYGVNALLIFIIASLYLLLVIFMYNKKKIPTKFQRCDICGRWEKEKVMNSFEGKTICTNCSEKILNASSDSIKQKMLKRMLENNKRRLKLYGLILNLFIPGGGLVLVGQFKRGFVYMLQFVVYMTVAFYSRFIIDSIYNIPLPEITVLRYLFLIFAALVYIISEFAVLSLKEEEIKYA